MQMWLKKKKLEDANFKYENESHTASKLRTDFGKWLNAENLKYKKELAISTEV